MVSLSNNWPGLSAVITLCDSVKQSLDNILYRFVDNAEYDNIYNRLNIAIKTTRTFFLTDIISSAMTERAHKNAVTQTLKMFLTYGKRHSDTGKIPALFTTTLKMFDVVISPILSSIITDLHSSSHNLEHFDRTIKTMIDFLSVSKLGVDLNNRFTIARRDIERALEIFNNTVCDSVEGVPTVTDNIEKTGVSITYHDRTVYLNNITLAQLECRFNAVLEKGEHTVEFYSAVWAMTYLYETIFDEDDQSTAGSQMHSAQSLSQYSNLAMEYGPICEMFASPLNVHPDNTFCSAFPKLDRYFGSIGNAFDFMPSDGVYAINPPFTEACIVKAIEHTIDILDNAYDAGTHVTIVLIMPYWADKGDFSPIITMSLAGSSHIIASTLIRPSDYSYRYGYDYRISGSTDMKTGKLVNKDAEWTMKTRKTLKVVYSV